MRALTKLKEEKLIFFDIETARVVDELIPDTPLYDSWDYKVNKDGEMTQEEVIQSYKKESGLYPEFSKIICIVAGKIVDGGIVLVTLNHPEESTILNKFNDLLNRNSDCKLIGFVNIGFDTPFVFKRMMINGIEPHGQLDVSGLKPWEVDQIDLAELWKGSSFARASLINIATALGLPSPKDDINGSEVGDVYWNGGEKGLSRISKYCRKDVETTINIFRALRFQQPLEVTNKEIEEQPLLINLFGGAKYGEEEKQELIGLLSSMDSSNREKAFVVLDSLVSTAASKRTKFTKAHLKELKGLSYE